ncbi:MAG: septation protein SepH [Gulosibacter sp.]|uniref:septation protein SepH n=1 Tax=Gulosibacter sp. TaxID=2817531 RepID=UPI003F92F7CC
MQELRFVGLEDDWLIATNDSGERFRLRADESLRDALRPRPAARPEGPRVPPRQIQQLIRAGRTVDEVVAETGADAETVARFEGPILAERGYIVEQARAVAVRLQSPIDPLSPEGATFGTTIDDRLEQLGATGINWDAWKDPETGWHVGLDFVTEDVARNALWQFDARAHTLQPSSPAAITLSQQGEPSSLVGPHLRAVKRESTGGVIPVREDDELQSEALSTADRRDLTSHETADLLEALRRRRGERQHATYEEEAEFDLGEDQSPDTETETDLGASRVTPFARPATADSADATVSAADTDTDEDSTQNGADSRPTGDPVTDDATAGTEYVKQVAFDGLDQELDSQDSSTGQRTKSARRRGARPSMPSWDEIVFGTKSDED